jgi:hypothetical protein
MIRPWLIAFAFTQLVEVPIYSVGLRCNVLVAFGASAITHPIVWFVICGPYWDAGYWTKVVVAELFAWSVEACYFAFLFKKRRAWLWSLVANGASLGAGLASRALFGVP